MTARRIAAKDCLREDIDPDRTGQRIMAIPARTLFLYLSFSHGYQSLSVLLTTRQQSYVHTQTYARYKYAQYNAVRTLQKKHNLSSPVVWRLTSATTNNHRSQIKHALGETYLYTNAINNRLTVNPKHNHIIVHLLSSFDFAGLT